MVAIFVYIHNHENYGSILWGNSLEAKNLFKLTKKAIRIIAGVKSQTLYRPIVRKLIIITLASLYILKNLIHVKSHNKELK